MFLTSVPCEGGLIKDLVLEASALDLGTFWAEKRKATGCW